MLSMMMQTRDGPTIAQRTQALAHSLEGLRTRFKDGIARIVGSSAAQAVRDFMRRLLGVPILDEEDDHERQDALWSDDHGMEDEDRYPASMERLPDRSAPLGWLVGLLAALVPLAAWLLSLA